ncbi:TadE/TadG family type IV pilus assembly protein [Marinobacterium aestuariivivens]|uniref:TadE/TadG family type IV pilus assembly protein n=1 Tax=Marinobacterium aestuariivivens TaxID=1698799 RepID=A0ABW2A183_9GAMM
MDREIRKKQNTLLTFLDALFINNAVSASSRLSSERQRGSAGIEFVLVFPVFFIIFYAIVNYGLIFSASQMLQYSAEEGLRRSLSFVDESCYFTESGCESASVRAEVEQATRAMLSQLSRNATSTSLGSLFGQSLDEALQITATDTTGGGCCQVQLHYDYENHPFLPPLMLPVPGELSRVASLNL